LRNSPPSAAGASAAPQALQKADPSGFCRPQAAQTGTPQSVDEARAVF
jgi:hypothetical protein